jgi:hypothetical protein
LCETVGAVYADPPKKKPALNRFHPVFFIAFVALILPRSSPWLPEQNPGRQDSATAVFASPGRHN